MNKLEKAISLMREAIGVLSEVKDSPATPPWDKVAAGGVIGSLNGSIAYLQKAAGRASEAESN